MDYKSVKLFDMAHKKMRWLSQRQDVLAQNVANADTPDYRARDLVPLDFKRTLQQQFHRLQLASTSMVYEEAIDGNNVVLEEQLLKVQETQMEHQAAVRIVRKYQSMMKTAMGRNGV